MSEKLLTKQQAADILNVSPRTVNRLVAGNKLKAVKIGHIFRVDPIEIEKFKAKFSSR